MGLPLTRPAPQLEVVRLEEIRGAHEPTAADRLVGRLVLVGIAILIAGVVVQAASGLIGVLALEDRYAQLNPDREGNAFSWASASATFVAGFVAILLGLAGSHGRRLLALGAILIFFSLDDTVRIHETGTYQVMERITGIEHRLLWPMLWLPLLATAFLVLWTTARKVTAPAGRMIQLALGLLVAAVFLEVSALPIAPEGDVIAGWPYALEVVVEEGAELAAWILVALGLTATLVSTLAAGPPTRARRLSQ
jgi:hypothetical protein